LDDLVCVMEEILDVSADWYDLGLQLKVSIGTLDNIWASFTAAKHQLREMLKVWLTTGDNPSWKTLIDALRSRMVGASQLAAALETKYCPVERTEVDVGGHAKVRTKCRHAYNPLLFTSWVVYLVPKSASRLAICC